MYVYRMRAHLKATSTRAAMGSHWALRDINIFSSEIKIRHYRIDEIEKTDDNLEPRVLLVT